MADCIPMWEDGDEVTAKVTAAVVGATLVDISAAPNADGSLNVATCAANAKAFGVAAYDQPTVGGFVTVFCHSRILPVVVGAAVTFGQEVMSDATGRAIPWNTLIANRPVGKAVASQATVGSTVLVQLY